MDEFYGLSESYYFKNVIRKHRVVIDFYIEKYNWDEYIADITSNNNLNTLVCRYAENTNDKAFKEDNIYRIENLNFLDYSTFISLLLTEKKKINLRELDEIFDLSFEGGKIVDIKNRKEISSLTRKEILKIRKDNNLFFNLRLLHNFLISFEGDDFISISDLPNKDIWYKAEIIPVSWRVFFEIREIFEGILLLFIPTIKLKNLESLSFLHSVFYFFIEDEYPEEDNLQTAHDFVDSIFFYDTHIPRKEIIKSFVNKVKSIENFILLFYFLFKKDLFDLKGTNFFILKMVRLFSEHRKGFSERNIYKCIDLYTSEDIFELPDYKLTNRILRDLQ